MSQGGDARDLEVSVGYVLKQAQAALRAAVDATLAPLELTMAQYTCLELIGHQPGISGSELARGAFVSRQAMNQVLRGLQERGLLARPSAAEHGRARPTRLTPAGRATLSAGAAAVAAVERHMLSALAPEAQARLRDDLAACATALTETAGWTGITT